MSSIIDALYEIKYNPFVYGSYLASFYSEIEETENNLLLAPLVIPLCSHPFFSIKLIGANDTSSIWTIFGGQTNVKTSGEKNKYGRFILSSTKNKIKHKELLYDLKERIDGFQELTKQSIDYCLVNDWLTVNEQRFSLIGSDNSDSKFIRQKSAEKLGRLFSGHSVVEIYDFLGMKLI